MTDLSDFGGGIDEQAVAEDRRDDEQEPLGTPCSVNGCDGRIVGLDDGWEFNRGVCCQDCIDFQDRHGHWPDDHPEACPECAVDNGAVHHYCDESNVDSIILNPGSECEFCEEIAGLSVTEEDGLWLPTEAMEANRLIIRTPTKTINWRASGEEANRRHHLSVTPGDWDEDYLAGDGRTAKIRNEECLPENNDGVPHVGLLIAGTGKQQWVPVEIEDGDQS